MTPSPRLKKETGPVSETLFFFFIIWNSGRWRKFIKPVILSVIQYHQSSLHSNPTDIYSKQESSSVFIKAKTLHNLLKRAPFAVMQLLKEKRTLNTPQMLV
jgi:hypothetical protein